MAGFAARPSSWQGGLNLIEGANEAGKSTLQAFIGGMFYGFFQPGAKRRSYTALQERYRPWDGGSYRGVLVCRKGSGPAASSGTLTRTPSGFGSLTGRPGRTSPTASPMTR